MRLLEILAQIGVETSGLKDFALTGIAPLDSATPSQISYIDQKKYLSQLSTSRAGAVLIRQEHKDQVPPTMQAIIVENPHLAFARISHFFKKPEFGESGAEPVLGAGVKLMPNVVLGKNVVIGEGSEILAGVVISDNVKIGKNCRIYPNVVIYRDSILGDNVIIHAGSIIGSDGFGYAHTKEGEHVKIEHNGRVVIEDNVEIGANNTIDRAVFGETRIQKGAKIDNLVQIGHNCDIGAHSILVSQVGVAGSTTMGRNVIMGGQAGTGGHIHIGDFVTIAGRGAVGKNLPPHTKWGGHPLMELEEWIRFYVHLRRMVKNKEKEK